MALDNVKTWDEMAQEVAELLSKNEFLEKRNGWYKGRLAERSAQLIRAIRVLQEEGINFEVWAEEVKTLAELLNEEPKEGEKF